MFLAYYTMLLLVISLYYSELYVDGHNEHIKKHISMTHQVLKKNEVVCGKMSMYRSYFLKNGFYAKKGNEKVTNTEKVYIKHTSEMGGIYALVQSDKRGVKILADGSEFFFNNFDKLDGFLNRLQQRKDDFMRILRRKNISQKLRMLDL